MQHTNVVRSRVKAGSMRLLAALALTAALVAPAQPAAAAVPADVTVTAVGDMMFSSGPGQLLASSGPNAPFSAVAPLLRDADVTVGNLETALSYRGSPQPKTFTFRGSPSAVYGMKWAGFDLIAQGNNHAGDYGDTALVDTIRNLDRAGLAHAGAGTNRKAAWTPAIITRNGARIAFLSFSQITPTNFAATASSPGTAWGTDKAQVMAAVKSASQRADYVIVSFHWGTEKQYSPTSRQVTFGRAAIDSGADLVLSHHPHVIQGVEYYRKGAIAYSLGNFVFSPGSDAGRDTMILHATMTPDGVTGIYAEPVHIGSFGKPSRAYGSTANRILGLIKRTSAARGTLIATKNGVIYLKSRVPFVRRTVAEDEEPLEPASTEPWYADSVVRAAIPRR